MKRLPLFGFLIGLVFSSISTIHAQDANTTDLLCGMTAPASCFSASTVISGQETKKRNPTPTHCPQATWDLTGLRTGSSVLNPICTKLVGSNICDTEMGMRTLQTKLTTECGSTCAPETIIDPVNQLEIACSEDISLKDGKYGLCTEEAVRRYLEWYKVENCNIAPSLTITAPKKATQGEAINAKITSAGGTVYKLNEELFKAEKVEPIKIENIVLKSSNDNVHTTLPQTVDLNKDIPLTFSSTGTTNLSATGTVVEKPGLEVTSNKPPITIKSSPPPPQKTNNELGCNQLLPKYLVGASCDTELKGDARDITYWLQKFSGQITTFIAAIAVLLIAWNAFGLVMAAGDSDQLANGKKALMWVGIGLLLTVFAYVIIKTALSLTFLS